MYPLLFNYGKIMHEVIEEIVNELSKRIPSGIVDFENEEHINELINVMTEYIGDQEIINHWVANLQGK
jgi:hypothetical protein